MMLILKIILAYFCFTYHNEINSHFADPEKLAFMIRLMDNKNNFEFLQSYHSNDSVIDSVNDSVIQMY